MLQNCDEFGVLVSGLENVRLWKDWLDACNEASRVTYGLNGLLCLIFLVFWMYYFVNEVCIVLIRYMYALLGNYDVCMGCLNVIRIWM